MDPQDGRCALVVLARNALTGVPPVEQEHLVHRAAGLLRPGGRLVVAAAGPGLTREDVARWAADAGLGHVRTSAGPDGGRRGWTAVFDRAGHDHHPGAVAARRTGRCQNPGHVRSGGSAPGSDPPAGAAAPDR